MLVYLKRYKVSSYTFPYTLLIPSLYLSFSSLHFLILTPYSLILKLLKIRIPKIILRVAIKAQGLGIIIIKVIIIIAIRNNRIVKLLN
jgi:hypothetical protein